MKRLLPILMVATICSADTLPNADIARVFVNLGQMHAIAFGLEYRLATRGTLELPAAAHDRAVAVGLRDEEMIDPWGTPYRIEISGKEFRIIGAGADRTFHPEEWPARRPTRTLEADSVIHDKLPNRHNYSWAARMLDKIDVNFGLYEPPSIPSTDSRLLAPLLADPKAALRYEQMWESASIALGHGEIEELRATLTLSQMQLLAARIEAWRVSHGTLKALAGKDVVSVLRTEPWPFNDWLPRIDEWGTPLTVDIAADGQWYRIASPGSNHIFESTPASSTDSAVDQIVSGGAIAQRFDPVAWQKREMVRVDEADRKAQQTVLNVNGRPIYRVGGDIKPPVKIKGSDPQYTQQMRNDKIEGIGIFEAVIDEKGHVTDLHCLFAQDPSIENAGLAALRQWEFQPGMHDGKPVPVIYNLTIMMRLE